jgi:signal transduction histidine kinase
MSLARPDDVLDQVHADLHELCQPLTALQCRLEIGRMMGNEEALLEAVDGGLEETRRMFEVIDRMRERLSREGTILK